MIGIQVVLLLSGQMCKSHLGEVLAEISQQY